VKIDRQTVERWRQAIAPLDTPETRARYIARDISNAHTVRDINARYSFDLLWAAIDRGAMAYTDLSGYEDTHIATALRRIVPKLEG
jgi:hypothetical protein